MKRSPWLQPATIAVRSAILGLALLSVNGCDDGGLDLCGDANCSGHGRCVEVEDRARCLCDQGYEEDGLNCVLASADGDGDADVDRCRGDEDCDDQLYCNGSERCAPTSESANDVGCIPGEPPSCDDGDSMTEDTCNEALGRCVHECPDNDGDGHGAATCLDEQGDPLGDDCNDDDANRYPGNLEVCDEDHHDEDCDLTTVGDTDLDGDSWVSNLCCNIPDGSGELQCGPDCDDSNAAINPAAQELCDVDDLDENCDGRVNEFLTVYCYPDWDDDGFAAADAEPREECPIEGRPQVDGCPPLTTNRPPLDESSIDCDERRDDVYPGADERCDERDNDCDGLLAGEDGEDADFDETDRDDDGFLACAREYLARDCADDDPRAHPGQREFFTTAVVGVGGFDFNCDGIEQLEFPTQGGCFPTLNAGVVECLYVPGWFSTGMIECGAPTAWVESCDGADASLLVRCLNVDSGWQFDPTAVPACR